MRPSCVNLENRLYNSIGIAPPLRVLDLGCGDGTTAVPLAGLGAEVVSIDIARNLVDAGIDGLGSSGRLIGMETFGAPAPLKELQRKFGFEPGRVAAIAKELLGRAV